MSPPQIDDYVLHDLIGESTTGQVWSADYREQSDLAIKLLNPQAINRQFIFDGLVKVLNGAPHACINGIYDFDLASETPYITTALQANCITLDNGTSYHEPRSLEPLCGQLEDAEAWRLIRQIADAVAHLHRLRVSHCGLKPANTLLDEASPPNIQINDIGLGIVVGKDKVEASDTLCYAPPEQLLAPDQFQDGRSERWDVYSFGVVAYRLLTGQFPRLATFVAELRRRRASNPEKPVMIDLATLAATLNKQPEIAWPTDAADSFQENLRRVIEACLETDPDQRPADMRDVREALEALERRRTEASSGSTADAPAPRADETTAAQRSSSRLPAVAAVLCAAVAALLALGHLRNNGIPGLWKALTLQKSEAKPAIRIADNGDLVGSSDPKENPESPASSSNNEEIHQDQAAEQMLEELRLTSETVDEVFRSLVSRDAAGNPVFSIPDGALGSILAYYEDFSQRHQNTPELVIEAARAFNSAGEIKLALGDMPGAIQSTESAVLLLEPVYKAEPDNGSVLFHLAFFKHNLAEAQHQARLPKTALVNARAATELYETLADRNPSSAQAQRSLVQSYIYLGSALSDAGQLGEADLILDRAMAVIQKLSSTEGENEYDISALTRIEYERASLAANRDKTKEATDLLISVIDRQLDPLLKSEPTSVLYRSRLAMSYALLADVLIESGATAEANEANNQAIGLFAELTEELPDKIDYRRRLADRFMTLAELERDAGDNKEARAAAEKARLLLDDLVKNRPEMPPLRFDLAMCYRLVADLEIDAKMKEEALESGSEALKLIQDLLKDDTDPENDNLKRPEYRVAMAEFYDRLGQQCLDLGRKDDAKTNFEKAVTHFEYLATDPTWEERELAQKSLAASKASLAKLQ